MLRAIIIDDELNQRENLQIILENHCEGVRVVGKAENVIKGASLIGELEADVVFLDVQMPGGTGFDLLENIGNHSCRFVLVTAHKEYMQKAFKFNVFDYILKPVDIQEVKATVQRLKTQIPTELKGSSQSHKLVLPSSNGTQFIDKDQIICVKAEGSYAELTLRSRSSILVSKNLKFVSEQLGEEQFMRVHRSYLANLHYVEELVRSEGGFLLMKDGVEVPISPDRREEIIQRISSLLS